MTRSCGEGIVAASMKDEPLIPPGTASPSIVPAKDLMSGAASQGIHPARCSPCPGGCPSVLWVGEGVAGAPPPLTPSPAVPPGRWPEPCSAGRWSSFPGAGQGLRSPLEGPSRLLAPPHPDSPRLPCSRHWPRPERDSSGNGAGSGQAGGAVCRTTGRVLASDKGRASLQGSRGS